MLVFVGLSLVMLAFAGDLGAPLHTYTPEEYARFLRLNAFSAATLTAFVGMAFANAYARAEGLPLPPGST